MPSLDPDIEDQIRQRWECMSGVLDERQRRLFVGSEALVLGHGGMAAVSRATGLSVGTVRRGMDEIRSEDGVVSLAMPKGAVRRSGAGRPTLVSKQPELDGALEALIKPATRGDPESPLCWISKSARNLAETLNIQGHSVSHDTVLRMLHRKGFTLQKNRKILEGSNHPDRDAQFEYINEQATLFERLGQPIISVDTKKKELVGQYANQGRDWHPAGTPTKVLTYDFPNGVPKAVPYGVYDTVRNEGMVSVGISSDTAEFAAASIRRWWTAMGRYAYPDATDLMITADCGGSNGYRVRLWRFQLQELADELGLAISVCHLPPGTSKWNKIEHRMFSFISMNWRGRPLVSYETVVELIGNTRTRAGLKIRCELDEGIYLKGVKISDEALASIHIERADFHGEWNYTILPNEDVEFHAERTQ